MSIASSGQQATDSLNGKLNFEQDKNRIIGRDENNLPRLLILADGSDFVMKVSKEGFDAVTADNDDLIFNSNQNVFKIVQTEVATLPADATGPPYTSSVTVTHGLGYKPVVLAYAGVGANSVQLPFTGYNVGASVTITQAYYVGFITTTQVTFHAFDINNPLSALDVRYYLLQESAS